jgi:hypothetical protein
MLRELRSLRVSVVSGASTPAENDHSSSEDGASLLEEIHQIRGHSIEPTATPTSKLNT